MARVEISRREDVLGGRAFGHTGAYEKLYGKVYYAVSPDNPHNTIIVDLDKAPRNAKGLVEFSSDLLILRPKDPARGNSVVFVDASLIAANLELFSTINHDT